jgi:poly(hydroxyalkanoate) granule-associated protein
LDNNIMVKRFKKIAKEAEGVAIDAKDSTLDSAKKLVDNNLVSAVKDSAQQIWLAGLGAFAKAQEEGTKVFDVLVKEGSVLQKRTMKMTESKLGEVTGKVTSATGDLTKVATGTWDKLESVFEERVARSLNRLGVPTNADINALTKRVEELTAALQSMGAVLPAKKVAAKPRAAAKKAVKAVKKVAARKAK